ncbi:group II intron reverse transcriptase/maturase [Sorangium sp. So ce1128]
MGTASKPPGKAMYVAPRTDWDWLRNEQRKLHMRSEKQVDYVFRKLWGLVTDARNLRMALARVASNRGRRTAGVDGITVGHVAKRAEEFVVALRSELRSGAYRPAPVRRVLIPKIGAPGKFRPLGIPTVKDRVVQAALKSILEPVFEADFFPVSFGFRPGKSVHGALEYLRVLLRPKDHKQGPEPRLPYQWIVEGDIKGCFDNIDHHGLMGRIRRRVVDPKVNRLVVAFLKAGILSEGTFVRSDAGTPQGGILSPLLANIALSIIEERYERHVSQRRIAPTRRDAAPPERRAKEARKHDRERRQTIVLPIRYADDFLLLVGAPPGPEQHERARQDAEKEKAAVATLLKQQLGLDLSETKTLITPVTKTFAFLGHHVVVRNNRGLKRMACVTLIPKEKSHRLRERIKRLCRRDRTGQSLHDLLRDLNWLLRGWSAFYRHAWGAKRVFCSVDYYAWWTVFRWLRKKHQHAPVKRLKVLYPPSKERGTRRGQWHHRGVTLFVTGRTRVGPYRLASARRPLFAIHHGEPGA